MGVGTTPALAPTPSGEVTGMTTSMQEMRATSVEPEKLLELEHVDIHKALGLPPVGPTTEPPKARGAGRRTVAAALLAGLAGLAVGYGAATWVYNDQITGLERAATVMNTVPYGGFQSEYGAVREHQALADNLAAGGAQGTWEVASNGTRTFLMYPGS
jgi:hypothetical protein